MGKNYEVSEGYAGAGRPPKDIWDKMSIPVRAMVTPGVRNALMESQVTHGIAKPPRGDVSSDILRLAVYRFLQAEGMMTPELDADPSWDSLKGRGLI